jgi:hypothetical protein
MQRCLQTTIHMFVNHPNLTKIKFTVVPQVHEWLQMSGDIPADYSEVITKYAPGQPICQGIVFDFTLLLHYAEPQLWSILTLANVNKQIEVLSKLKAGFRYADL